MRAFRTNYKAEVSRLHVEGMACRSAPRNLAEDKCMNAQVQASWGAVNYDSPCQGQSQGSREVPKRVQG